MAIPSEAEISSKRKKSSHLKTWWKTTCTKKLVAYIRIMEVNCGLTTLLSVEWYLSLHLTTLHSITQWHLREKASPYSWTGLTLLPQASALKQYWQHSFSVSLYLINHYPTPLLLVKSSFFKLFGSSPNYQKLCIFGCVYYLWLNLYTRNKLEDISIRCVFFSYNPTQTAYLCYDVGDDQIYISRLVQFD